MAKPQPTETPTPTATPPEAEAKPAYNKRTPSVLFKDRINDIKNDVCVLPGSLQQTVLRHYGTIPSDEVRRGFAFLRTVIDEAEKACLRGPSAVAGDFQ